MMTILKQEFTRNVPGGDYYVRTNYVRNLDWSSVFPLLSSNWYGITRISLSAERTMICCSREGRSMFEAAAFIRNRRAQAQTLSVCSFVHFLLISNVELHEYLDTRSW